MHNVTNAQTSAWLPQVFAIAWTPFLTSVFAVCTAIGVQLFISRRNEISKQLDELIKLSWEYAQVSSQYWSVDGRKSAELIAEAKIVAFDSFINSLLIDLHNARPRLFNLQDAERLLNFMSKASTDGSFQSNGRKLDPARALEIYRATSEFCRFLFKLKRHSTKLLVWKP